MSKAVLKPGAMPNPRDLDRKPVAIILAAIEVIMNDISRYVPITKAKNDLLDLIRQIESADESVAVTKNGVPAAVILSMEKYIGLLETLEILSDEDTAKSLRASIRQARKGKWLRPDEVFRR
jgi:antitoxin YefM